MLKGAPPMLKGGQQAPGANQHGPPKGWVPAQGARTNPPGMHKLPPGVHGQGTEGNQRNGPGGGNGAAKKQPAQTSCRRGQQVRCGPSTSILHSHPSSHFLSLRIVRNLFICIYTRIDSKWYARSSWYSKSYARSRCL
jgi:hypothetical protein